MPLPVDAFSACLIAAPVSAAVAKTPLMLMLYVGVDEAALDDGDAMPVGAMDGDDAGPAWLGVLGEVAATDANMPAEMIAETMPG